MTDNKQNFCLRLRVRYAECDPQNVVFNARYADYVDIASTEFLREIIGGYDVMLEKGYDNQIVRMLMEWQAPARFDEILNLSVGVGRIGNTSFTLAIDMLNHESGEAVASAEAIYVLLDRETYRKTPIPEFLREALAQGGRGIEVDQSGVRR